MKYLIVLSIVLIGACTPPKPKRTLNAFYGDYFDAIAVNSPQRLTEVGIFDSTQIGSFNDKLNDESAAFLENQHALNTAYLDSLNAFDTTGSSASEKLSYDVLKWNLELAIQGEKFQKYHYPINQWNGVNVSFPRFMLETHPLDNERDVADFIARLWAFEKQAKQAIQRADYFTVIDDSGQVTVPSKFIIEMTLNQMWQFIDVPTDQNELILYLSNKLDELELSNASEMMQQAKEAYESSVLPAYKRMISVLETTETSAGEKLGLDRFIDGKAAYAHQLKRHTTTNMTAVEIFDMGISEAKRLRGEMVDLARSMGYECNDYFDCRYWEDGLKPLVDSNDSSLFFLDTTDAGRALILAEYKRSTERADSMLADLFYPMDIPELVIKEKPIASGYAGGYYAPPSFDLKRPGTFYIGLARFPRKPRIENTAFHEGIPGHHYQASVQWQLKDLPTFRKDYYYAAFMEGWAVYAERLCLEEGVFTTDHSKYQHLWSELGRAMRLIVDAGIHDKGWGIDEIMQAYKENTGQGASKHAVARYTVNPGQACAYMVGYLTFMRLREKMKSALGTEFDIRDFHRVVLEHGAMPLELLEKQVDVFIDAKLGK